MTLIKCNETITIKTCSLSQFIFNCQNFTFVFLPLLKLFSTQSTSPSLKWLLNERSQRYFIPETYHFLPQIVWSDIACYRQLLFIRCDWGRPFIINPTWLVMRYSDFYLTFNKRVPWVTTPFKGVKNLQTFHIEMV